MQFSIKKKIYLNFIVMVLLLFINGLATLLIVNSNKKSSQKISEIIDPSLQAIDQFRNMMNESKMYISNWLFLRTKLEDRYALKEIHETGYPELKKRLFTLSSSWHDKNISDSLKNIFAGFDNVLLTQKKIMGSLQTADDFEDISKKADAKELIEESIMPQIHSLVASMNCIINFQQSIRNKEIRNVTQLSSRLATMITILVMLTIVLGIFISIYFTNSLVKPIHEIRKILNGLGQGIIRKIDHPTEKDEIGEMVQSVNNLSEKLSLAVSFANQVGNRNFNAQFEPLSEHDELGKSIISMRDKLKKSEKELREADYQMQTFFENIDKVFFSIDIINRQMLQISPACEKIYGYTMFDFALNVNLWRKLVYAEDKPIIDRNYSLLSEGKPLVVEYRIIRSDKTIHWVETSFTPTLDQNNKLVRIDGITSDIETRKKVEEKLKENIVELKKTNMELDKFVYSVSHDLRAPLSSMLGVVEISAEDTHDPMQLEHLQMLKRNIKKLDGFIQDILDYSRNSRLGVKKEKIDFKEMLNEITDNLKYMNGIDRNVEIRTNIVNKSTIQSDKSRISIVLNNLISNAIRYQNPSVDNPFVDIFIDTSDTETNIIVKDNGIGIKKEHTEKIFDMFYRISKNSVGSGLGLYIVKETVEKLKGCINVVSEPGKGTEFKIQIPNN